jgi:FixJ family two-component response regulator
VNKGEGINRPLVSVIDDDESVRESLEDLLRELGFAAKTFSSGQEFLASGYVDRGQCLIIDISMPGMSGPDLYHELMARGRKIPVIFITAHDTAMRPLLLQQGAVECLTKPFSDAALLTALNAAIRE